MRTAGITILAGSILLAALSLFIWLLGLLGGIGGGLIHLLLVFAILVGPAGIVTGVVLILVAGRKQPR